MKVHPRTGLAPADLTPAPGRIASRQERPQRMLPALAALASAWLVLAGAALPSDAHEPHHTVVPGDAIEWGPAPPSLPSGAQAARLLGSPAEEGPFVLRLRFPAGFVVPPHIHTKDEFVILLSGSLTIQAGERVDEAGLEGLPPGTFIHLPAGMAHYLWAETESIVQINGTGPFDVKYIDPKDDPRTN